MKKPVKYLTTALLVLALGACGTESLPAPGMEDSIPTEGLDEPDVSLEDEEETEDDVDETAEPDESEEEATHDFEEQIEETIEIEGMEDSIVLELYDNADAPFITYVPSDFLAEETDGGSYTFYANYEDEKLEDINMEVHFFGEDVTEQPSLENEDSELATLVGEMEPVEQEVEWYEWSVEEYQSADGSRYALLGEHDGQYFVMVLNSEPLYSEGFIPRAHKIIEHFYWRDTEEYLVE